MARASLNATTCDVPSCLGNQSIVRPTVPLRSGVQFSRAVLDRLQHANRRNIRETVQWNSYEQNYIDGKWVDSNGGTLA